MLPKSVRFDFNDDDVCHKLEPSLFVPLTKCCSLYLRKKPTRKKYHTFASHYKSGQHQEKTSNTHSFLLMGLSSVQNVIHWTWEMPRNAISTI